MLYKYCIFNVDEEEQCVATAGISVGPESSIIQDLLM
jgi:hypothetical protein